MKEFLRLAALFLAATDVVSAHYIFQQLGVASTKYPVFKYIRQNSNYNSPVTDLSSNDLRCNVGADGSATETVAVKAGDSFTFYLDTPVYHQGPVSLYVLSPLTRNVVRPTLTLKDRYMSRAPGAASSYDGSGGWFKIQDWGPTITGGQATWPLSGSYTFTLPTCLPDGEYLLRIQSLGIHNPYPAGTPQFYISCAQIALSGGSGKANPPTVKIPGAFKATDPGYTANIYTNFNSYVIPGPEVWKCGDADGTAPPDTGTTPETPATPTTLETVTRTTAVPEATTPAGCSTARYGQCGGIGFNGCSSCAGGSTCTKQNDYYSQCI